MFFKFGLMGNNFDDLALCRAILASSWAVLGPFWAPLGPSWGHLGALLGLLGATQRPSWRILGPCCASSGAPWGHHWPSWGHLGPSWLLSGQLVPFGKPSWGLRGAFLPHIGPFGDHPGAIFEGILRYTGPVISCSSAVSTIAFYSNFPCVSYPQKRVASRSQALEEPRRGREALTICLMILL